VTLTRLALAEVGRLSEIELAQDPEPWAREAEQFVFSGELAEFTRRYRDDLQIMVLDQHERILAVAIVYPDPRFHARRIGAIVVDHRQRGRGFGTAVLQALVSGAMSAGDTVCWLVHPINVGMLTCSRRVEPTPDEAAVEDGYLMFVAP
jgi:ribosomal protein S18 acetylase RimI-like enzyme